MTPTEKAEYEAAEEERRLVATRLNEERAEREEAQRRRGIVERIAEAIGPRYSPERVRLDTFVVSDGKRQQPVIGRLREIVPELETLTREGRGLVFIGSLGTGKDHLAAALLYEAAERFGIVGHWINGRAVFQASRDAMAKDTAEADLLKPLVKPAILCVSDPTPGGANLTAWNVDLLYRVIDERYRYLRPTWLTLNVRDVAEADERLTPPVWDRLRDQAEIVRCFWGTRRKEARVT